MGSISSILDEIENRGIEKGIAQGKEDANCSTAIALHEMGLDDESIARATSSSVGVVKTWIYQ